MNDGEWGAIAAMLGSWWPGEWTEAKDEGYRLALDRYPARTIAAELERRLNAGEQFRPSAAAIVHGVRGTTSGPPPPDSEEAWALIEQAIRRIDCSPYHPEFAQRHQEAINWLAERSEVVAAFAARRGLSGHGSLGHEPINDSEHGGAVRHRIATDYRHHVELVNDRVARGLPAVEPHQLLVRGTEQKPGGFAEVLDALRPEAPREIEAPEDDHVRRQNDGEYGNGQ